MHPSYVAGLLVPLAVAPWIPRRFLFEFGLGAWPLFSLPGGKDIALTFDDGPEPGNTYPLIDALEQQEITATFFLVGERARRHPRLVKEIRSRGHMVGCHGMSHTHLAYRSDSILQREVADATDALEEILGESIFYFRPPFGVRCPRLYRMIRTQGMRPVFWSVMAYDWRRTPYEKIAHRIAAGAHPGAVVLLHDGGGPRQETVRAVSLLADHLRNEGYRFVGLE